MATFDPNRVGPGTFELVKDPSTGEYKLNQVGFTKLPDLSLPTIDQAPYIIPDSGDDDTGDDNQTPDTGTGGGGSDGGGGQDQTFVNFPTPKREQDFTGEQTFQNIQKQATEVGKADMGIQMEDISAGSDNRRALAAYNKALSDYNKITELNRDRGMGKQAPNPEADIELANAKNEVDMRRKDYESTIVNIGAAPVISEDLQKFGPRTVPTGTLTGGATQTQPAVEDIGKTFRSETDKFKTRFDPTKIEPAEVEPSVMEKAKNIVKNSVVVKVASGVAKGLKGIEDAILGPRQVALNNSNKNALSSLGYKTRGELGGSVDPGRIAGNPAENVFAGMNMTSATGDVMRGARNRVSTIQKTIDRAKAKGDIAKVERFEARKEKFNNQIEAAQKKKNEADLATGGVAPGASGGGGGSAGCFIKGTLITMLDGSKKPVEKVNLGDNVAVGGKVFAVGRFLNTELYDYKGIKVSGSHMVNEDGAWMRVRDTKHGKSLGNDLNTVYVFGSENRRILIDDILFTDYFEVSEQDQLINNEEDFFNNWKSYGTIIDKHNVNTLNAN